MLRFSSRVKADFENVQVIHSYYTQIQVICTYYIGIGMGKIKITQKERAKWEVCQI